MFIELQFICEFKQFIRINRAKKQSTFGRLTNIEAIVVGEKKLKITLYLYSHE